VLGVSTRGSDNDEITLLVDEALYSREALLRTCYLFTDRCYIFISRHDPQHLSVNLKAKQIGREFRAVAGEFANTLLDYQVRQEINRETATLRDLIVAKAFAEGDLLDDSPVSDDRDPVELKAIGRDGMHVPGRQRE
jgi:His-Xaa-Ser system protein HxsD